MIEREREREREIGRLIERERERERERGGGGDGQTDRQTDTQTDRHTDRKRQRTRDSLISGTAEDRRAKSRLDESIKAMSYMPLLCTIKKYVGRSMSIVEVSMLAFQAKCPSPRGGRISIWV